MPSWRERPGSVKLARKRPIITLNTPLGQIPTEWLMFIEPHILRGSYLPYWIWTGAINDAGVPVATIDGRRQNLFNYVAGMFWDFSPDLVVVHDSPYVNDLNPAHLYFCTKKELKIKRKHDLERESRLNRV